MGVMLYIPESSSNDVTPYRDSCDSSSYSFIPLCAFDYFLRVELEGFDQHGGHHWIRHDGDDHHLMGLELEVFFMDIIGSVSSSNVMTLIISCDSNLKSFIIMEDIIESSYIV